MNSTENFLLEYWFARRSIGRLMMDLGAAKAAQESVPAPDGEAPGAKAHAARALASQRCAEVMSIEARLAQERATLARIEAAVAAARLSPREREYVRLRYFENRSVQAVSQRLYVSPATAGAYGNGA
jgi:DNA-directed RNA polymerase specialized sigma24 family protein